MRPRDTRSHSPQIDELSEFLRIPSISADRERAADLDRAAQWIAAFIEASGGNAAIVPTDGPPLVTGEIQASSPMAQSTAPTVMIYGHYDVQPPGDTAAWESPPFDPTVRDGWLYARGAADDKGPLYALLKGVQELAAIDQLPVNVKIVSDGEEEIAGTSVVSYLRGQSDYPDVCLILDGPMPEVDRPALTVGTRGLAYFHVELTTGERDLHSGLFGGAALNAADALISTLGRALRRRNELQEGVVAPSEAELRNWAALEDGTAVIRKQGGCPADDAAGAEFYRRTWAMPAVDVHGIRCGEADQLMTIIPSSAGANISIRLVPRQVPDEVARVFETILTESAPAGAALTVECMATTPPVLMDSNAPALRLATDAFERVFGVRPQTIRCGGSVAILSALVEAGIPTVLSGLDVPEGNVHAPNERFRVDYISKGIEVTKEMLTTFAQLPRQSTVAA
jgi:acetylornithine deacetylase/succinyl-diaminopimelate desuccinylase-like protein